MFGELKENSSVALRSSACFVYLQTKEGFNLTCCLFYKLFCNEKGNISLSFIIIVLCWCYKTKLCNCDISARVLTNKCLRKVVALAMVTINTVSIQRYSPCCTEKQCCQVVCIRSAGYHSIRLCTLQNTYLSQAY